MKVSQSIVKSVKTNPVQAAFIVALLMLSGCRGQPSEEPPIHLNPNMDDQDYQEPQEANRLALDGRYVAADHRVMRSYMAHTVPTDVDWALRDSDRYYQGYTQVGVEKRYERDLPAELSLSPAELEKSYASGQQATWEPSSRARVIADLVDRGEDRFNIYCVPCHDATGSGRGSVIIKSNNALQPPTYHDDVKRAYPVGRIYDVATNGFGTMPSLKAQIPVRDRWAIALYVKTLQVANNVKQAELPENLRAKTDWGSN